MFNYLIAKIIWFFTIPWVTMFAPANSTTVWGDSVDPTFMRVMHCESRGDQYALNSSSGASGLMQHMPQWWDWRAEQAGFVGYSPFDPVANIWVSFWLLTLPDIGGWQHWECY